MEEQKVPEAVAPPQETKGEIAEVAAEKEGEKEELGGVPQSMSRYFRAMHEFRYATSDLGAGFTVPTGDQEELGIADPARLNKEIRNFARDSPCESAAAIFVAMDSARMHLMRALISGPEDTPYAHGLYAFDIGLRESYPNTPPLVKIATTGESKARFNPNLYNDGYVCLSIINTWEASPEEMWNPSASTLLQVLLSIQSLVMDNAVLQKEPGYETYDTQDPGNLAYCAVVKYNNVKYAMRKMIQHPPEEFKEVVWRHFSLKREEIVRTCEKWVEEAATLTDFANIDYLAMDHNTHTISKFQEKGYLNRLSKHVDKLKTALSELPPVP